MSKEKELQELLIKSISVLQIQDGDVVVIKTHSILTDDIYKRLCDIWQVIVNEIFPNKNVRAIILEAGMDIEVLREGKK